MPPGRTSIGRTGIGAELHKKCEGDYSVSSANFLSDFCVDDSFDILYILNLGLVGNILAATCHTNHSAAENMVLLSTYMSFLPLALPAATLLHTFPPSAVSFRRMLCRYPLSHRCTHSLLLSK
jgi:hypothetical protein